MGHAGRAHLSEVNAFRNLLDDATPMTGLADHRITFVKGSMVDSPYTAGNDRDRR
jgi:hypothetical protein